MDQSIETSSPTPEYALALSVLSHVHLTTEDLGHRQPRKGKKVPAAEIRANLQKEYKVQIALEGPYQIGKTTALQHLTRRGYHVHPMPPDVVFPSPFSFSLF